MGNMYLHYYHGNADFNIVLPDIHIIACAFKKVHNLYIYYLQYHIL